MKMLFLFAISIMSLPILGQEVGMLSDYPGWLYAGRSIDADVYSDGILWRVGTIGDRMSIDGREYDLVRRYLNIRDAKPSMTGKLGVDFYSPKFHLREADGKVYALRDEYVDIMAEIYGVGGESLFMEECNDGEILLYDFTLGKGDRYPCRGGVYVEAVYKLVTEDGIPRKCLVLTNGMVVIEGIGCVNALGEFYGYQNTSAISHGESGWLVAFAHWDVEGEDYQVVYRDGLISSIAHVSDTRETVGVANVYDLQGRKVQTPQRGGLYIQNGKKFIQK